MDRRSRIKIDNYVGRKFRRFDDMIFIRCSAVI